MSNKSESFQLSIFLKSSYSKYIKGDPGSLLAAALDYGKRRLDFETYAEKKL